MLDVLCNTFMCCGYIKDVPCQFKAVRCVTDVCLQADLLSKRDAQPLSEAGRSLQPPVHPELS